MKVEQQRGRAASADPLEERVWSAWMNAAALIAARYSAAIPMENPFSFNETASVGMLHAAAACAGYVSLSEFCMHKAIGEERAHDEGRCDLWMLAEGRSWFFEFKQCVPSDGLNRAMENAEFCAKQIIPGYSDAAVAGLIVPLSEERRDLGDARHELAGFARQSCDLAWAVTGSDTLPETWLLFSVARRWNT